MKQDRLSMKFSPTPIKMCIGASDTQFRINTPFFSLPPLCQNISQPPSQDQQNVE